MSAAAPGKAAEAVVSLQAGDGHRAGRRRWVKATAAGAVVGLAGAAAVWLAGGFGTAGSPGTGNSGGGHGTSTALVSRRTLASQTTVNATLGYAGSYTVTGKGGGTLTWLPAQGRVIREGQVLYRTGNGVPVVLLHGTVPAWRALQEGMTGADVTQLNHDLVRLGYADSGYITGLGWDHFSWETRYGLEQLQTALGITNPTGTLPLGSAVFEPSALRVSTVSAQLGGAASGGIFTATSDRPVVTISLSASQQSEVKAGDAVTVTTPDGQSTPGGDFLSGEGGHRIGELGDDPGACAAGSPGRGRWPGSGAGDGDDHYRQCQERAGGAGDRVAGPLRRRVRGRGGRTRRHPPSGAGDRGGVR